MPNGFRNSSSKISPGGIGANFWLMAASCGVASPLRLVVVAQEVANALHDAVFGVDTVEKLRPIQRVAGEEAFVQHLPAAKGATGDVPGQSEELDAFARAGGVSGEILFDLGLHSAVEILFRRNDH